MALALPSLGAGWQLDDHLHRFYLARWHEGTAHGAWWDLYQAAEGDPTLTRTRMNLGYTPWWTLPELRIRFFRPLAAATHLLDHTLWPSHPALMHAHSLVWYGALVGAVAVLLRRLCVWPIAAAIAGLLFALDEAHATPAGWIAQRNAPMAALGVALALVAHDRWQRDRWRPGAIAGPLALAFGLACGELAAAGLAFVAMHAVWLAPGGWRRRAASLLPYAGVFVLWRIPYRALGYGAWGSGLYIDPMREPASLLAVVPARTSALLLGDWTWPAADAWTVIGASASLMAPFVIATLVALAIALGRSGLLDRRTGFAASSYLLALVASASAPAADRMLLVAGIPGSMLLGLAVAHVLARPRPRALAWWPRALVAVAILVRHVGVAAIEFPIRVAGMPRELEALQGGAVTSLPADRALADQDLVVVNSPPSFVGSYLWMLRDGTDAAVPRRLRVLGSTYAAVIVSRPRSDTLVLNPVGGYMHDPFAALFRSSAHPLRTGEVVELDGLRLEVTAVHDGRPYIVTATFDRALEDPSLRWVTWRGDRFEPFVLPPVGGRAALPGS